MTARAITRISLAAVALALPVAAAAEDFRWQGRVAPGRTLEVKGVNGRVEAVASSSAEAEVTAVKRGRRSDPETVEVKVVEHDGGVTVCAVYPTPSGEPANECRPGRGGRMNVRDNDVSVDFTVRVPAGVHFAGRTVNGEVEATGLGGDVEAYTVNGGVRVETSGLARAETVNGSIEADAGRADWTGALAFKTVNGSITVRLPADASAEVEARTVNGAIETEFPLTVTGRWGPRRLAGRLGQGGRELKLETVNGAIELRRSR